MYPPPSHLHSRGSAYLGTELPGPHTTLKVRARTLNPHSIPALWGTRDSFVRSGNQGSETLSNFAKVTELASGETEMRTLDFLVLKSLLLSLKQQSVTQVNM